MLQMTAPPWPGVANYTAHRELVRRAKRDILAGRMIVREPVAHVPATVIGALKAWCEKDETLQSWEEMSPRAGFVVLLAEARAWISSLGIPVPEWLQERPAPAKAPRTTEKGRAEQEGAAAVRAFVEEIRKRADSKGEQFDPMDAPPTEEEFTDVAGSWGRKNGLKNLSRSTATMRRYRAGIVKFQAGKGATGFYRKLFPELF